jgi:hypothetical protein
MHGDDGYDDFQERMADYFKSPHNHQPTVYYYGIDSALNSRRCMASG